jgi:hypothetical protein
MKTEDYTTTFTVDQSPEEVFDAINNVRGWWSEELEGSTGELGAEFKFHRTAPVSGVWTSTQPAGQRGRRIAFHAAA